MIYDNILYFKIKTNFIHTLLEGISLFLGWRKNNNIGEGLGKKDKNMWGGVCKIFPSAPSEIQME